MEELRVDVDGASLAVSWTPAGDAALVALHGASEGTRDFFHFEHLHATLPPLGIGVATFDRRGEGDSTGDSSRGHFELQARDAIAVRDALPAGRAGLWGLSQGGWSAPIGATLSDRVDFLVLIASTGVTPAAQMTYAVARQLELAGYGDDVVARALDLRRRFEAHVHGAEDTELAADLLAVLDEPWSDLLFPPPAPLEEDVRPLWSAEMDFDPVPVFERVGVPTLCFYGDADSWMPVEPSAAAWRSAGAEVVVIPGAEHDLTLPDGTLSPVYEETLVDWLLRVAPA